MSKPLEQTYRFKADTLPLVVVDLRVSVFSLLWKAKTWKAFEDESNVTLLWEDLLNNPLPEFGKMKKQVIVVDDTKYKNGTYWRQKFLDQAEGEFPKYKGNRKPEDRPEMYYTLHRTGVQYCKDNNIPYFNYRGFEADDFAGAIAKIVNEKKGIGREVILFTVDSDWGQLINDEYGIKFYYSSVPCWKDRLRDEAIIKQWFDERQNILLSEVRDIVTVKSEKGDVSDNLIPGSPAAVIDLMNPGRTLPKKVTKELERVIMNPECNTDSRKAFRANWAVSKLIIDEINKDKLCMQQ